MAKLLSTNTKIDLPKQIPSDNPLLGYTVKQTRFNWFKVYLFVLVVYGVDICVSVTAMQLNQAKLVSNSGVDTTSSNIFVGGDYIICPAQIVIINRKRMRQMDAENNTTAIECRSFVEIVNNDDIEHDARQIRGNDSCYWLRYSKFVVFIRARLSIACVGYFCPFIANVKMMQLVINMIIDFVKSAEMPLFEASSDFSRMSWRHQTLNLNSKKRSKHIHPWRLCVYTISMYNMNWLVNDTFY